MSGTPIYDAIKLRQGFDPLEDVEFEHIVSWDRKAVRTIPIFGGSNEWHK